MPIHGLEHTQKSAEFRKEHQAQGKQMSASTSRRKTAKRYTFTILLDGIREVTEKLETALYEAGCDDALLWKSKGRVGLDFTRRAKSKKEAVTSAKKDIERAGLREAALT
jgi:hypothetical protein